MTIKIKSPDSEALEETYRQARATAYAQEADPLFFKWQRGEIAEQEWLDAVEAIRARFPYPES